MDGPGVGECAAGGGERWLAVERAVRQGFQRQEVVVQRKPAAALFSGWNWVAKILSRASAEVKRPP